MRRIKPKSLKACLNDLDDFCSRLDRIIPSKREVSFREFVKQLEKKFKPQIQEFFEIMDSFEV
jgi:hypothetical protein